MSSHNHSLTTRCYQGLKRSFYTAGSHHHAWLRVYLPRTNDIGPQNISELWFLEDMQALGPKAVSRSTSLLMCWCLKIASFHAPCKTLLEHLSNKWRNATIGRTWSKSAYSETCPLYVAIEVFPFGQKIRAWVSSQAILGYSGRLLANGSPGVKVVLRRVCLSGFRNQFSEIFPQCIRA